MIDEATTVTLIARGRVVGGVVAEVVVRIVPGDRYGLYKTHHPAAWMVTDLTRMMQNLVQQESDPSNVEGHGLWSKMLVHAVNLEPNETTNQRTE